MRETEIESVCVCVNMRVRQEIRQGNHSHSFRSIRFFESQECQTANRHTGLLWRDTCTPESLTYREKQTLAHVSLRKVNTNKTNQTEPVMTPPPPKIICAAHYGWRRFFSADTVHPRVTVAETNSFQLNPILSSYNNFLTTGKVPDFCSLSARMRHLVLLLCL